MSIDFRLDGRLALVTGSTRGIGLAIARAFAAQGAQVVVSNESPEDTAACAAGLRSEGLQVSGIACDVSRTAEQQALVHQTLQSHGRLDVVVCNAGITGKPGPFATIDMADYDRVMAVDLRSMVELSRFALPHLSEGSGGSLILISSIAGLRGNGAINAYALAKAGVAQLARNLAVEWGAARRARQCDFSRVHPHGAVGSTAGQ
jgi:NAD(P)-dependent dehydrogenase (short-subunit alcohol dehydrogenase family)